MFCITAARVRHVTLTSEKTEKANLVYQIDRPWRKQSFLVCFVFYTVQVPTAALCLTTAALWLLRQLKVTTNLWRFSLIGLL